MQTRRMGQYKIDLTLSPRLYVEPLITLATAIAGRLSLDVVPTKLVVKYNRYSLNIQGRTQDFRERSLRYGPPKAVPFRGSGASPGKLLNSSYLEMAF